MQAEHFRIFRFLGMDPIDLAITVAADLAGIVVFIHMGIVPVKELFLHFGRDLLIARLSIEVVGHLRIIDQILQFVDAFPG